MEMAAARQRIADFTPDHYPRFAELSDLLVAMHTAYPDRCRLRPGAHSAEGRPVWALTVADGDPEAQPAILVDAAMHAGEIIGPVAALHLAKTLLEEPLPGVTVYILPCIAPDGYEQTLTTPCLLRSSPRQYPDPTPPDEGLSFADVDGDGRIRVMRQAHPLGEWKVSALDPRIMVRRAPDETEAAGPFYRLFPEGFVLQPPGRPLQGVAMARYNTRLDFNRNFPAGWAPEAKQTGAGRYPLDQPETRALADFVLDHPNISLYLSLHAYGGVLLRPPTAGGDETMNGADLHLFDALGEVCQRVTGYPCKSSHFAYSMGQALTRTAKDWAYEHAGLVAYTLELWDPDARAGAKGYRDVGNRGIARLSEAERELDELKRLQWLDRELGGEGFKPWTPVDHPQLGPVEIGGWDLQYTLGNPPPRFIPEECGKVARLVAALGRSMPRLAVTALRTTPLEGGVWRVEAEVANTGYMATNTTKAALDGKAVRPVTITLELPDGATLLQGRATQDLGHLDGWGAAGPMAQGMAPYPSRRSAWAEWLVAAPAGAALRVTSACPRAGQAALSTQLH